MGKPTLPDELPTYDDPEFEAETYLRVEATQGGVTFRVEETREPVPESDMTGLGVYVDKAATIRVGESLYTPAETAAVFALGVGDIQTADTDHGTVLDLDALQNAEIEPAGETPAKEREAEKIAEHVPDMIATLTDDPRRIEPALPKPVDELDALDDLKGNREP